MWWWRWLYSQAAHTYVTADIHVTGAKNQQKVSHKSSFLNAGEGERSSTMVVTKREMEKNSKALTASELSKLHLCIQRNPALCKKLPSDSSESEGDVEDVVSAPKTKTIRRGSLSSILFTENKEMDAIIRKLRVTNDHLERKYRQLQVVNSNLHVDLEEQRKCVRDFKHMFYTAFGLLVVVMAYEVAVRLHRL